jgi:hypothetical protein
VLKDVLLFVAAKGRGVVDVVELALGYQKLWRFSRTILVIIGALNAFFWILWCLRCQGDIKK